MINAYIKIKQKFGERCICCTLIKEVSKKWIQLEIDKLPTNPHINPMEDILISVKSTLRGDQNEDNYKRV